MGTLSKIGILALFLTACRAPTDRLVLSPTDAARPLAAAPVVDFNCDPSGSPFGGGNGTADSPNLVCSPDQLVSMRGFPNDAFLLAADLDFAGLPDYVTPGSFHGTFDGGNHTISNLRIRANVFYVPGNISYPDYPGYLGLWYGLGNSAVVKNLKMAAVDIAGYDSIGAIAPSIAGLARVENVHILSGSITASGTNVGAIAAINDGTVHECDSAIANIGLVFGGAGSVD